jgi:hypothetical protein
MDNYLKVIESNKILNSLSEIIKSNSVKENLEEFKVLNLAEILSSYNIIDKADDYHSHLDSQDFSFNADDVEIAFSDYNGLKQKFKETYSGGVLFKPYSLTRTVDFTLSNFSKIFEQSEELAINLLNNIVDAMNIPTYEAVRFQKELLKEIISSYQLTPTIKSPLFSKSVSTDFLGEIPISEKFVVEDLGLKKDDQGKDYCAVRTALRTMCCDVYKKIIPISSEMTASVSYHTSNEGLHILSLNMEPELERLGYGAWLMHSVAQQADINNKKVFYSETNLKSEKLDFFSRQWCNFLYNTPQVNIFKSFQIKPVKFADDYKKRT